MNDREKEFLRRMARTKLSPNQARIVFGLLGGLVLKEIGLCATSQERTITEMRKSSLLEKVNGRWQLTGDVAGMFDVPAVAGNTSVTTPTLSDAAQPAENKPSEAVTVTLQRHPFTVRPGSQVVAITALMELSGVNADTCNQLRDLAVSGKLPPADLMEALNRAESLAVRRFPA